jgi:hypothetical protein
MVHDSAKGREVKKRHWEIDLIGTGKQAVIPPSIHPATGLPYRWERELDTFFVETGIYAQADAAAFGAETGDAFDLLDGDDEDASLLGLLRKAPLGLDETEIDTSRCIRDHLPDVSSGGGRTDMCTGECARAGVPVAKDAG